MSKSQLIPALDLKEREHALDTKVSVLVQAPAGSGKTTILTDRYLKLLGEVDDPQHIVAITFTNAAAAEMRNRILDELRKPEPSPAAQRAINRSRVLGWRVLELPEQLRIATIDSFCRELALQQPMLSQLSGQLNIDPNPAPLYRNAARRTLAQIDTRGSELAAAVEILLLWRDNNWQELEDQLLAMLKQRDRWMHGFVLERDPDWEQLRKRLERPFRNEALKVSGDLHHSLNQVASLRDAALALARFACENPGNNSPMPLAGCMELRAPSMHEDFDSLLSQYRALTDFLLTSDGTWRSPKGINKNHGFPPIKGDKAKQRFGALISELRQVQGLQSTLSALQLLPPAHYSDEEWSILRACFMLLRHAAGELRVLFAENGVVDFIEVAQAATHVLARRDGTPSDAALAVADGIHHLLVDEFQDTSRKQHALLSRLISAWPEREGRTCFIVGDPMQSIYFFRDADTELFARIKSLGLETADGNSLPLEFVPLATNFRTDPALVAWSNDSFARIFGSDRDGEISFNEARAVRKSKDPARPRFSLHLKFIPDRRKGQTLKEEALRARETAYTQQIDEIVATIRGHQTHIETTRRARASGSSDKYRVAILARAKKSLVPIANTLRKAQIPFRALDAEGLREQQEVLDVLALAKAWLNPFDRVAWLGVLRAPWCGLKLDDLHVLISADDLHILERPVPVLMEERLFTLSSDGRNRVERILHAYARHQDVSISSLGTWLEQIWLDLGGAKCVDAAARSNLEMLWMCLDGLPNVQRDLLGPALDAALDDLKAQPDPETSSDCGVQLMTIHKAKGLEFEVVIVPELQTREGHAKFEMLSWLERGLTSIENLEETTEFLVAPFQTKGSSKGDAKAWVDRVRRDREEREMKRLLYVAATRAREELHLFARPSFRDDSEGLTLVEPKNSLLATAWPALEENVRTQFEGWRAGKVEAVLEALAASTTASKVTEMPLTVQATRMRRLPTKLLPTAPMGQSGVGSAYVMGSEASTRLFERHDGGMISRTFGTAVHRLLQEFARLRLTMDWSDTSKVLESFQPRVEALIRAAGMEPSTAKTMTSRAVELALVAAWEPFGRWILSPHPDAASEVAWAGVIDGRVRVVRVDRVFRASLNPLYEGEDAWWIVDYKSVHQEGANPEELLPTLRTLFAPQLEAYARILRELHGTQLPVRAGLYYPRMQRFDWWETGTVA